MFIADCLHVNATGHLTVGGCDAVELAKIYGTPLYVMDENTIRQNLRIFKNAVEKNYPAGRVLFASKACSFTEIYRILREEGCGADVVSGGELYTAIRAGLPPEVICFHGNNKTAGEIQMALSHGVGRIAVDNLPELYMVSEIAAEMGKTAHIQLRLSPGIEAHTHEFVQTGQIDSKFGLIVENGDAMEAIKLALSLPGIKLHGVSCHIGSQIVDTAPFIHTAEVMLGFMADVRDKTGFVMTELNLGGGYGVVYTHTDDPPALEEYIEQTAAVAKAKAAALDFPFPFIMIEPGRSVVASAGVTLYTVGSVKQIPNGRTYVIMDGGMADNPRYALYGAEYTVLVADRAGEAATEIVTVAGRCCESGDLIQEHTPLQPCGRGDTLAVLATGAYNYSMSSNYNRLPRPAVVMVKNGESRVVVKGETYEDIVRNDV